MASFQTVMDDEYQTPILDPSIKRDSPFLPLLTTVFTSILEVFLLCLAGYILAGRGILDKKTQKQLNRLNVSLFTPSLLFSKVAFFLSPEKLKELWIIPIFFVLVTSVSMSVSFFLGWIFRVKRSQRNFAMAAAMFMNSNSLPIALMQSLVVTVPGLKWGQEDNKNAMVGRALTYLVLYSTLGMVLRWSYGVRLLAQSDPESEASPNDETSPLVDHQFSADENTLRPTSSVFEDVPHVHVEHVRPTLLRPGHERRRSRFYNSFPNSPNQSRVQLPDVDTPSTSTFVVNSPNESDTDSDPEAEPLPHHAEPALPQHVLRRPGHARQESTISQAGATRLRHMRRRLYRWWVALNEFMTVPLWAALASLVVACVRPLQHALEEHMQPIKGAVTSAGNCSIPLTLIVLGGYFYPAPPEDAQPATNGHPGIRTSQSASSLLENVREMFGKKPVAGQPKADKPEVRPGETKTVVIAVVSRMIVTPLLLLPLMALSTKLNLHAVFEDPVFVVANVLLVSSPPALTLAQITQAASGDAFERLISRTIFWAYCVVTPPATIVYVVLGLMLSKL
ncbi:auxin efflux carrier [Mycena maculata]|uniref:Auxin efflux carrier n=1 Tax=Mycena maculata TaxID=230809 RepID=A0AAD7NHK1_9AGAR|nr:auxin efflux carrier [Mycena maculata]